MNQVQDKILIIDDELQIRKLLRIALESHNYKVFEAATGEEGIVLAATNRPDLIILDLGLPDKDGKLVLQNLREWYQNPILILSVRNDEENIVMALDGGANDYIRKPFNTTELLARLRVLRRLKEENNSNPIIIVKELIIDVAAHKVTLGDKEIKLTATEFSLLRLLASNQGKVITHSAILKEIWGPKSTENTQYLRVYIGHLRQKLEKDPNRPQLILTETGVGYRFCGNQ